MRKKDLLNLNAALFAREDTYQRKIETLKSENDDLKAQIDALNDQIVSLKSKLEASESLKKLEDKIKAQVSISEDKQYGAEAIGKIVLKSAEYCTQISSREQNCETKELVNLILGRTEIAKAEILKIVSDNLSLEAKKNMIDQERLSAEDYFLSVLAQKD